jgi:tRNA (guanine26-N2/guanine27-N2)-dimethyltransferase
MRVREGKAVIEVEEGIFYNPRMRFCRDFDIAVFNAIREVEGEVRYLDALSATGVRGIRASLEAGYKASFNDLNEKAIENIKKNLRINGIDAEVYKEDANILVRRKSFFHIDIDPFGSPSEFIDSAVIKPKYLSVTATDTAALCGSAPASGLRKYSAYALKTEYYPEVGIRILIGKIFSEAGKYDKAPEVLVSYTKEHFYRVHLKFKRSSRSVRIGYKNFGFLFHCFNCLRRYFTSFEGEFPTKCDCGERFRAIGPLWLGEIHSPNFMGKLEGNEEVRRLIQRIREEIKTPFFYDLHFLAMKIQISPPPLGNVIDSLREIGFSASKTRFSGTSFKTDAPIEEIYRILRNLRR